MNRRFWWPVPVLVAIALAFGCSGGSPTAPAGFVHAEASLLSPPTAHMRIGVSVYRNDHTESLVQHFLSACGTPSTQGSLNLPRGEYIVGLDIFTCDNSTFTTVPVVGFVEVDGRQVFAATATAPFLGHPGGDVLVVFKVT